MKKQRGQYSAAACIQGGEAYPRLSGKVTFTPCQGKTLVTVRLKGLPASETGFFALHIHGGGDCGGAGFANTGSHFDLRDRPHPLHAGDLPPLLSCGGEAYLSVLTDRFCVGEVIGRTVVIHSHSDDFRSQPSGDAGAKIACGRIVET